MDERTPEVEALVRRAHELHREISHLHRDLLDVLSDLEGIRAWEEDGAYDMSHWIGQQFGISRWKADRWLVAGHALRSLPVIAGALSAGELGIDKVVELTRFATPEDDDVLARWARHVASGGIRRRAELLARREPAAGSDAGSRSFDWRYAEQGTRMHLWGDRPPPREPSWRRPSSV